MPDLVGFMKEDGFLREAWGARRKISGFYVDVVFVTILGAIVYIIEGENSDFTSIPRSVYWAIVTVTTGLWGYSSANTNRASHRSFIMYIGYAIIAVPTGIVSAEMVKNSRKK